ncbi:phosphopyruvate hydratase [Patescibacteria group bacterium]|nr:phosphopyruvate hydratase [Patescibacteria group bacterium]
MFKIKKTRAQEIIDSRGNPTVFAEMWLEDGSYGKSAVPSGASTGIHEALELRDGDEKRRGGRGVLKACENVNTTINDAIVGKGLKDQRELDEMMIELDGTDNKSKLGANAILSVSLAFARAAAAAQEVELYQYLADVYGTKELVMPRPMMNILNGGEHADNKVDVQEFMIIPEVDGMAERIRVGCQIFHTLKKILKEENYSTGVGDEGGFAPELKSNEEALQLIIEAINREGFRPGQDVNLALDVAASSFYKKENDVYFLESGEKTLSAKELMNIYKEWMDKYPLVSIEDPLAEDDWENWQVFTEECGDKIQIVGDDLLVTNIKRLEKSIEEKAANAILIKLNQIGSLTETLDCMQKATKAGYNNVVSHRSGETSDAFIADLAIGTAAGQIKTGSVSRGERTVKYNRLMRIERMIGE